MDCASDRFLKSTGENAEFDGIYLIDSYSFKVESAVEAIATKHNGEEVVVQFDNGVVKKGTRINEIAIDGKLFVEGLFSRVKDLGAQLHQQHFKTLDDILALDESIIINCTSLGSRELFNDQDMTPVRGQIIYFKPQEGVDYLMYQNVPGSDTAWVSIFPRSDRIVLGGVKEKGEEELIVNPETISNILENARKVLTGEF